MAMDDRAIREQFQRILGRDARPDEIQVFNEFMRDNDLTPFEIGQAVQGLPEYQNRLLEQQGQQYKGYLDANDDYTLGKAQSQIQSQFARMGRPSSSGYTSAFANAAKDLAAMKQDRLAQFYGGGFGNIRALAAGQGEGATQRGYGLRDERRQRGWAIDDYYRAKNDNADALRGQGVRNLQGSLLNAGINLAARGTAALATKGMSEFGGGGGGLTSAGAEPYNPGARFNYGYKQPGVQDFYNIPYRRP